MYFNLCENIKQIINKWFCKINSNSNNSCSNGHSNVHVYVHKFKCTKWTDVLCVFISFVGQNQTGINEIFDFTIKCLLWCVRGTRQCGSGNGKQLFYFGFVKILWARLRTLKYNLIYIKKFVIIICTYK